MNTYTKPIIMINEELAEGVYASSGSSANTSTSGAPSCDSQYMQGKWQAPAYVWDGPAKKYYGCMGCPSYTPTGCGLDQHFEDSNQASSYEVDNGNRRPIWESKGYTDTTIINETTLY